ncbi:flavin reductase family protein [Streptomyces otsuchiensis]|uniref:flavin reductase family protein n=1 Tax=Streptomyces otsuchiensis TaxID=2681388 RepID=UPI0013005DB1|nr:flavin reductase family protein [Streptomyces otsuchiensis]
MTFRAAMGLLPTGVTVVTVNSGEQTEAVTASSVTSISLDPLLVMISIGAEGRTQRAIERHGSFTVNVMSREQEPLARAFASRRRPAGTRAQRELGAAVGLTGNVLVDDAVLAIDCRTELRYPGGDHVILLGRVEAVHTAPAQHGPLVYHRGAYAGLDLEAVT